MKKITILGASGSIGAITFDILKNNKDFKVEALSANNNYGVLASQANILKPDFLALTNEKHKESFNKLLQYKPKKIFYGKFSILELIENLNSDLVLNSIVGAAGMLPTLSCIKKGIDVALANKESLVVAGNIIMNLAKKKGVRIIPVDSEHNAIFQCLEGRTRKIKSIIITASGGPFLNLDIDKFSEITPSMALNHPNWGMGKKISIDSATMVNKVLEMIEAKWLFNLEYEKINIAIHPQSIVHGVVEFIDGSYLSMLGPTNMSVPISYALYYPKSAEKSFCNGLDFKNLNLNFVEPDSNRYPVLSLAKELIESNGTKCCAFNAANEIAVDRFLKSEIKFTSIFKVIEKVLSKHKDILNPSIDELIECDMLSRKEALGVKI